MENNELVVYGENGEIVECSFERVDFNNHPTIMSYGDSVIDELANVLESSSQLIVETPQEQVDAKTMQAISTFDESLDESAEKSKNPGLIVKVKRGLSSALSKIGINAFQEVLQEDTFVVRYKKQREMLAVVKEILGRQNERILAEISLTSDIIKTMEPLIKKFDTMIEVGQKDLATYREETDALALSAAQDDFKAQKAIRLRRKVEEVFEKQLNELANMSISYEQQVEEYQFQQLTDMSLVSTKTSQIKHGVPVLESQASLMVKNKEQEQAIAEAKALDDAINNAIKKNADDVLTNITGAMDLDVNGGIRTETQEYVGATLSKAVDLYKIRDKKIKERIEKDTKAREKLKAERNRAKQEILGLFEETFLPEGLSQAPVQKTLGGK